jgi:hypothetical protein
MSYMTGQIMSILRTVFPGCAIVRSGDITWLVRPADNNSSTFFFEAF